MRRQAICEALRQGHLRTVAHLYRRMLGRPADVDGLLHHARRLLRGARAEDVVDAIAGTREYRERHAGETPGALDVPGILRGAAEDRGPLAVSGFGDLGGSDAYTLWGLLDADRLASAPPAAGPVLHLVLPAPTLRALLGAAASIRAMRRAGAEGAVFHLAVPRDRRALRATAAMVATLAGAAILAGEGALADLAQVGAGTDDLVAILDPGDRVSIRPLLAAASLRPDASILLSDGDDEDARGERSHARLRGGWDPERDPARAPVGAVLLRGRIAMLPGGGDEPLTSHAMLSAASSAVPEAAIAHLPHVLHHRRVAAPSSAPPRIALAARPGGGGGAGVLASIVIAGRDNLALLERCIRTLPETARSCEIVVVDNGSDPPYREEGLRRLAPGGRLRTLRIPDAFNWSRVNDAGVRAAEGRVVVLLNDDTYGAGSDWLGAMVEEALRPEVGAVGAKLLYPDGTVQHAGIVFQRGDAWHAWRHARGDEEGYLAELATKRTVSAVTGACIAFRREVYEEVGGLSPDFAVTWGDVDLCLRVRRAGYRVVWTPQACLFHVEQASRGSDTEDVDRRARHARERERFRAVWGEGAFEERYFSPHLDAGAPVARIASPG